MRVGLVAAVVVVTLTGCGARAAAPEVAGGVEPTTTTPPATTTEVPSTSTTSTTPPSARSTSGIQPGQLDAIVSCEPELKGAVLDVVGVSGPYAAALLHKGSTLSRRTLTLSQGRWYDGNHGHAACDHRIDESFGAYPPASTWGPVGFSDYFDTSPPRDGSMSDGTLGSDGVVLVVGINGKNVTKGSIGGGYWMVLTIDAPRPAVYCGYDANGRLLYEGQPAAAGQATAPGGTGPTSQTGQAAEPASCPAKAPSVT